MSRVADAEWLRSCENVRRFGPSIGKLSEWRAFCEGGWTGPIPQDLRDVDELSPPSPVEPDPPLSRRSDYDGENDPRTIFPATGKSETMTLNNMQPATDITAERTPESQEKHIFSSPTLTQMQYQSRQKESAQSIPPSSFEPPRKFTDNDNLGSVRSLSQFPAPPTHFPLPPPLAQRQTSTSSLAGGVSPKLNFMGRKSEENVVNTPSKPVSAEKPVLNDIDVQSKPLSSDDGSAEPMFAKVDREKISPSGSPTISLSGHSLRSFPKGDYLAGEHGSPKNTQEIARTPSVIAALKSRYSYTVSNQLIFFAMR